jgi:hypothetical protein
MKKIFFLFTLTTLSVAIYGQAATDYKKNSLGLDLVPIVQNIVHSDSLIPYGITYRRFITPNHALRLRVDFGYKNTNLKYPKVVSSDSTMNFRQTLIGLGLGYERNLMLLSWLSFNFGGTISYRWIEREDKLRYTTYAETESWGLATYYHDKRRKYPEQQLTVMPFIGLYAYPSRAVSVAVEFSVGYRYTCLTNRHFDEEVMIAKEVDVTLKSWGSWGGMPAEARSSSMFSTVAVNLFYNF